MQSGRKRQSETRDDVVDELDVRSFVNSIAKRRKLDEGVHGFVGLLSETYPHGTGNFLRLELVSYLPVDNFAAASSTCRAMRNSVHDTMKGIAIPLPDQCHILTKRVALLEWGMSNGYQLKIDRNDDDREIEFHKPDTWVQRIGSITRVCLTGNLEILRYLRETDKFPQNMDYAVEFAAYGGHMDCLDWLCEVSDMKSVTRKCLKAASYGGNVEVLDWLRSKFYANRCFTYSEVDIIGYQGALGGHRSVIQWLRDSGFRLTPSCCLGAAEGCHRDLLQWLIGIKCLVPYNVTRYAGMGGSKAMLAWLRDAGHAWNTHTSLGAAEGGHVETLLWLLERGCPLPTNQAGYTYAAVRRGRIPMLEWLIANDYPTNEDICEAAASCGQLATLQFLRSQGYPWDSGITREASEFGQINTLRWALENGCPVTSQATVAAAKEGHLNVLKMLVEEFHCDLDVNQCLDCGQTEPVLAWLKSRRRI